MELAEVLRIVGFSSVALLAVSWLAASFASTPAGQSRLAWVGACALYLALGALFLNLCRRAWEQDSTVALVAFGFLLFIFTSGFLVSVVKTIGALRAGGSGSGHATH